jgi:hypothetical protein
MLRGIQRKLAVPTLAIAVWLAPVSGQTKKNLTFQVRSESWVDGSGFDSAEFTKLCDAAQISLLHEGGNDGMLVVEYVESKGSGYSTLILDKPRAWGTDITFKWSLLSLTDGSTLFTMDASTSTPSSGVSINKLHEASIERFKALPQYRLACSVVATILGSRTEAAKLLAWAVDDVKGVTALEKAGFKPTTPREKAFWAVARHQWSELDQAGSVAAEPLTMFIQSYVRGTDSGSRSLHSASSKEISELNSAVNSLATTGDPSITKTLQELLTVCDRWRRDMVKPVVITTLGALGRVGNVFSLSAIDAWLSCKPCEYDKSQLPAAQEIMQAASEASKSVRARLVKK